MTFNPLMTRLCGAVVGLLEPKPTVIELGNQTLKTDRESVEAVLDRLSQSSRAVTETSGTPGIADTSAIDPKGLALLAQQSPEERGPRTGDFYKMLGFSDYQAIDINTLYGSLVMDLNEDLRQFYDYHETFSLVTNNGTGEHVFNQDAIFRNIHQLTKPGGIMVHVMPMIEHINHGFYAFQPNLYYAIARANEYDLIALGLATRWGDGVIARNPRSEDVLPDFLRSERTLSLQEVLSGAKPPRRGAGGRLRDLFQHVSGRSTDGQRFHREIRRLQRHRPKINQFVVMRKNKDAAFRTPIQLRYVDDIDSDEISARSQPPG